MRNNDIEFEYNSKDEGYIYVNEERLEEEILLHLNSDIEQLKIPEELSRDAYLSLTKRREDIIKWYPFDENGSLLEIGAGYGELTKNLCSRLKKVDSYEPKSERIYIIEKRCREYDNLSCYTGVFSNQEFDGEYDYILIHDIFAIARKFFKGANPNVEMLVFLKKFLKPDGKLILIAENRLGLRYFAGAAEDYNRQFFWGLNSFEQDERNRTFSKSELTEIIENSGFEYHKWFYPYPNAVCTKEIFTEEINSKICYGLTTPDYEINEERFQFFDEQRMYYTLYKEGIVHKFANAFFVECSNQEVETDIAYANLEKKQIIHYQREAVFVQNGEELPDGVRVDVYLGQLVQQVVNCNLGSKNPYIGEIYSLIEKIVEMMQQYGCDINDVYISEGKLATTNICNNLDMYSLWEQWYVWYENNIMFYRNAFRRISLERIMEIIKIDNEMLEVYYRRYRESNNKYVMPRLPDIMFDFEPGQSKDRLIFKLSDMEEENLSDKLKRLHGSLHMEE